MTNGGRDMLNHADGACAVATVSPVAALCETSMKPACLGFEALARFDR